jgi:hypothetical protein
MSTCYICHRTEEEVKKYLLEQIDERIKQEEQNIKMEMEENNKKVLDLKEEWENIKVKASSDISTIMNNDVFYLLKNVAVNQNIDLKSYFDRAGEILGSSINSVKAKDIESKINEKIEEVKNLGEYTSRVEQIRNKYKMIIEILNEKYDIIKEIEVMVIKNEKIDGEATINVPICDICFQLTEGYVK